MYSSYIIHFLIACCVNMSDSDVYSANAYEKQLK